MNPGYTKKHLEEIKENAKTLNIPIEIFNSDIFASVEVMNHKSPCYMCARMRRGHLYNKAQELGCNKIALGHHFDDVIETTLLSNWSKYNHLTFLNCACKMTEEKVIDEEKSKRKEIKKLINNLRKINPYIDYNIFKSMENINLTQILGYKKEGKIYSFLDDYDK